MSDREPKFQVGDLVRHRASGTLAVVSKIHTWCKVHVHIIRCDQDCRQNFRGSYTLKREFGDSFSCDELVLEAATRDVPEKGYDCTALCAYNQGELPEPPPNRDTTEGKLPEH